MLSGWDTQVWTQTLPFAVDVAVGRGLSFFLCSTAYQERVHMRVVYYLKNPGTVSDMWPLGFCDNMPPPHLTLYLSRWALKALGLKFTVLATSLTAHLLAPLLLVTLHMPGVFRASMLTETSSVPF